MKHSQLFGTAAPRIAMGCLLALGVTPTFAAGLFVAQPGNMTRYELPGYTLAAVDNPQLRRDMTKLPRLKRALELSLGIDVRATGIPTYVYIVSSSIWDRYLEPSTGIPSEFVPTRFTNYIIADNTGIDRGGLFHEHTHLYLYNQMPGVYPTWFDEGLAVMMAQAQYTESQIQIFPPRHNDTGGWIPTARLLRVTKTSPEYLSEKELYSFHFQSYAMLYRALIDQPDFGKNVFKYLEAFNNLASPDEAEKALGVSVADLDFQMRNYVNNSGKKRVMLDLKDVTDLKLPAGTPMSKLDSLLGIATICLDAGLHLDMVHELLDAADVEPGGKPRATPLRMRLAARLKDDSKLEELYGILSKESDAQVARAAGLALFDRAQTLDEQSAARRTDLMTRSFDLLNRSLATQADDPEAVWAFAMLSADLKRDLDVALQRLVPMFDRLPSNPDMAHAAGKVLYARGDPNVMPYLTAVLRYAHTIEQKRWALDRINALRAKAAAPRDAAAQ